MPAGRSNRVLFDLIPQRDAEPSRASTPATPTPTSAKPVVRVELKPQEAKAAEPVRPTAAPRPAESRDAREPTSRPELPRAGGTPYTKPSALRWPAFLGTNALPVPLNLIYLSVAALVILAVVLFIWGRAAGEAAAIERLGSATPDIPSVVEPDGSPRLFPPNPTPTPSPTPNPRANPANTPAPNAGRQTPGNQGVTPPATAIPAPFGAILTARGPVMTDPRVAELNYLSLASLGEEDAKAAIAFLSANGVDAIGVPRVDPSSQPANNQGPTQVYRIYALPGITRDEYAQKLTARTNLEAAVAKIGATWQREHRGASNFARTQWEKFKP